MFDGAVNSQDQLPSEFDEVTAEVHYPPITKETTEKEFVRKAGNGYLTWVVVSSVAGVGGFGVFMWAMYEMSKWL